MINEELIENESDIEGSKDDLLDDNDSLLDLMDLVNKQICYHYIFEFLWSTTNL